MRSNYSCTMILPETCQNQGFSLVCIYKPTKQRHGLMIQLSDVNSENAVNALKDVLVAASEPPKPPNYNELLFWAAFLLGEPRDIHHSRAREVSARTSRSKSSGGPMPCSSRSSGRRTRSFFVAGPFSLRQPKGSGFWIVFWLCALCSPKRQYKAPRREKFVLVLHPHQSALVAWFRMSGS